MKQEIKNVFNYINSQLGFRLITPINMQEEKKKLEEAITQGRVYDPVFLYPYTSDINFERMKHELNQLTFDSSVTGKLYSKLRDQTLLEVQMYQAIAEANDFTTASQKLYGMPDHTLERECLRILTLPEVQEEADYDASELKLRFERKLQDYRLNHWEVVLREDMGSKVLVGDQKIFINKNYRFSENDLKRLCAHEISTHVLREENGKLREDEIFSTGSGQSMETEEGLSIYNEELSGALNLQALKIYAARFLCILHMNGKSLYELTMMIKDYVGLQQAIYIASRIKVGLSDTKAGGGFCKDYIYLQGYYKVKQAVKNDPNVYQKLYYGRIALEELELLEPQIAKAVESEHIILPQI